MENIINLLEDVLMVALAYVYVAFLFRKEIKGLYQFARHRDWRGFN